MVPGVKLLLRQLEIPGKVKAKRTWSQGAGLIFLGFSNLRPIGSCLSDISR